MLMGSSRGRAGLVVLDAFRPSHERCRSVMVEGLPGLPKRTWSSI